MFDTKEFGKELEERISDADTGTEAAADALPQEERSKSPQQVKKYAQKVVQMLRERRQSDNPYAHRIYGGRARGHYGNGGLNDYGSERTGHYHNKIPQGAQNVQGNAKQGKQGKPGEK